MTKLEIVLICVSTISILLNIGVFAYARACVGQLLSVSEEFGDLKELISNFSSHLSEVYKLEMFYGDQTLQSLVKHAKSLDEQLETFEYIYSLTEEESTEELTEEELLNDLTTTDYFSVITKNWFIHKVKRQQKRNKREVDFDNIAKHYEEEYLSTDDSYLKDREVAEFWNTFYTELDSWDESQMKDNDLRVYKAINILFESKDDIEIFNKKAIYLYLREITGLNTKQIVNSLKKFRKKYTNFKIDWENGEL